MVPNRRIFLADHRFRDINRHIAVEQDSLCAALACTSLMQPKQRFLRFLCLFLVCLVQRSDIFLFHISSGVIVALVLVAAAVRLKEGMDQMRNLEVHTYWHAREDIDYDRIPCDPTATWR